ncbi:MAG TPA: hypothetical protein GXX57_04245 [Firmicutes bacterium]|jgi:uncharacterized membrane protein YccF (DUF307 family)|nr:hypothetical protein [Bacillota bacterium]
MTTLGNLIWFVLGGGALALLWLVIGILFYLTIVGIPIGRACLEFAKLSAFPYGKEIIRETELKGKENICWVWRIVNTVLNIIWFPIGLALTLVYFTLAILYFLTIVGIPIAVVYVRMGQFLLAPAGCRVVSKRKALASAVAREMDRRAGKRR